jgi:hypothetical protein
MIARVLTALLLVVAGAAEAGETLDRVRKTGVLNDLTISEYPPFGFINAENRLDGFDVDVAKAVADRLGVTLKLATPGWETIVSGRWHGRWDVCICSMSPTPERAKVLTSRHATTARRPSSSYTRTRRRSARPRIFPASASASAWAPHMSATWRRPWSSTAASRSTFRSMTSSPWPATKPSFSATWRWDPASGSTRSSPISPRPRATSPRPAS